MNFGPHPEPELAAMQRDTFQALEIADEQAEIRAMSHGELEARVLDGDRAQATAPPDVSRRLRLTAQAEADAWQQSAAAETEHDPVQAHNARALVLPDAQNERGGVPVDERGASAIRAFRRAGCSSCRRGAHGGGARGREMGSGAPCGRS
ncbi:MAG: hypothetical protein ACRDPY_28750, partial [Streptosporangiaceae bacterium]